MMGGRKFTQGQLESRGFTGWKAIASGEVASVLFGRLLHLTIRHLAKQNFYSKKAGAIAVTSWAGAHDRKENWNGRTKLPLR
jgi:hypothetical protein